MDLRNTHIGIAVSFSIMAISLVFFHDAGEGVWQAIGLAAFFSAFAVSHGLDALDHRRGRDR